MDWSLRLDRAKLTGPAGKPGTLRLVGALAAVVASVYFAPPARAADRVYWGNCTGNKISFANVDGSGGGGDLDTTGTTPDCPWGLAIDAAAGRLYWVNNNDNRISFANLDGSGGGDFNTGGATVNGPYGVAIDPVHGKLYWANNDNDTISFANLDGSGGGNFNTSGATVDGPIGVTVDAATGRLYWTNASVDKISFANLDGSGGGGDLDTTGATPNDPEGAAIDPTAGRIYWANQNASGTISFAKLSGGGGGQLNTSGATANDPDGVAIDPAARRIYWANLAGNKISFANLDGSGGGDLPTTGATVSGSVFPALLEVPSGAGAPAVTGGSVPGSVLSCSRGSWAADLLGSLLYRGPQTFAYQWSRNGADIAGATASSYTASAVGDYRCRVRATNDAGTTSQTSLVHSVAPPPPPLSELFPGLKICMADALASCQGFGVATGKTTTITKRGSLSDWTLGNPAANTAATIRKPAKARDCNVQLNLSLKEKTYARFYRKLKRKLFNDKKPKAPKLAAKKKKRSHLLILARKQATLSADGTLTTHLKLRKKARKLLKAAFKKRKKRKFKATLKVYAACNGLDGLATGKRTIKLKLKLPAKKKK
jgi:DNA-binding beta-propeller fold protein YncE